MNKQKIVLILLAAIIATLSVSFIWYGLTHGTILVKSSIPGAEVSINDESNNTVVASTSAPLKKIVKTGNYIVSLKKGLTLSQKLVNVRFFRTTEVDLGLSTLKQAYPVTNYDTGSVIETDKDLTFVNNDEKALMTINKQNDISFIRSDLLVRDIVTVSGNQALVKTQNPDYSYSLYSLNLSDGSASIISFPNNTTTASDVAITESKIGTYYVSVGSSIYSYINGTLVKLIDAQQSPNTLIATNTTLVAAKYSEDSVDIATYSLKDKKLLSEKTFTNTPSPLYVISITPVPDSDNFVLTDAGKATIYSSNFTEVGTLPDNQVTGLAWKSSSVLFYTSNNVLWKYNPIDKTASSVAVLPKYVSIIGVSLSQNGNSIYLKTQASGLPTLYVVSSDIDPAQITSAQKVGESNMQTLGICSIHYVNYTKVAFKLSAPIGEESQCITTVQNYLNSIGVSVLTSIQIQMSQNET